MSLSITSITGRLGYDPKSGVTKSGKQMCQFSIAVDTGFGENKVTDWFNVSIFGRIADACSRFLQKGSLVAVSGTVHLREYKGKDGTNKAALDLLADKVEFIGKPEGQSNSTPKQNDDYFPEQGLDVVPF